MDELFVIGDIYGHIDKMQTLLSEWKPDKQKLFFLGNLIGRGENSFQTMELAKQLHDQYGAVILGGSQEEMFIEWLSKPNVNTILYYNRGGREVINSFANENVTSRVTPENIAQKILFDHYETINFICNLPDHAEYGKYLIVPAGVRLNISDWRMTTSKHFRWGHESFQYGENKTGKIIIFGHMPTKQLHRKEVFGAWMSSCKTKIGLNGFANQEGYCNAVHINKENYRFISSQ